MKKRMAKKMKLAKETLRTLEDRVAREAAGGCSLNQGTRNQSCITDLTCPTEQDSCVCGSIINSNCC
jgi:hypothetical protein